MSSKPGKRARTKRPAPAAPTADQLEQKLALRADQFKQELFELRDQLEHRLLGFPPLMKIFQAVGVDPASPTARLLVTFMVTSLYYGIKARLERYPNERRPRQAVPNAKKWTRDHDIALALEVVDLLRQDISEREAIKRIAAEPRDKHPSLAHRFPYEPQTGRSEAGRQFSQSTDQERREKAFLRRWKEIKKDEKVLTIVASPDEWLRALGFSPREAW
jgi:hypothetical protein